MAKINSQQVEELKRILPPSVRVVTPSSENYAESIKRFAPSAEKPAGAVTYPTSAQDVSLIVKFAVANGIHMAVVCGGHATSGSSSSDGGIVIDLSQMRKCVVDAEKKTVSIQGGALWADADAALAKYGLATVGGTVNHTGVGGLTLGGGYGWLSGRYGMTIDNLLEVEFVLADGSIVTCSSTNEPDLFWAARGAGQGFGVATKFVLQAYEQKNQVWAGMLIFPPPLLRPIFEACNDLLEKDTGKSASLVVFIAPPPEFQPIIGVMVFYNGPEEEAKPFFEPLLKLGPLVDMTSTVPYEKVNGLMNDANPHGTRRVMKGSALIAPIDPSFAQSIWDDYITFRDSNPDIARFGALFEYVPSGKIIEVPQKGTAFSNRGAYQNILFVPSYTLPENDAIARKWAGDMAAKTKKELDRMIALGTDEVTRDGVGEYSNYADFGEKGRTLFGVNYPRLTKLKQKYDPKNVFGKQLNLL